MSAATHYFRKRSPAAKKAAREQRRGGMRLRRKARRQQRRARRGYGGPLTVEQIRRMLGSGAIPRPTLARALGARGVTTVIVNPARRRGSMAKRRRRRRGGRITRRKSWPARRRRARGGGRRRIVRRRKNPALGFLFRNPKRSTASVTQGAFEFADVPREARASAKRSAAEGRKAAEQAKKAAKEAAKASHQAFVDAMKPGPHPVFTDVFGTGLNKEQMRHELDPFGTGFSQQQWDALRFKDAPFGMSKAQIYQAKVDGTYRPWMEHAKPPAFLRAKAAKAKKAATAAKKDAKKAKAAAKRAEQAAAKVKKSKAPASVKAEATKAAKKAKKAAAAAEVTAKVAKVAAKKTEQAAKAARKGKKPSAAVAKGKATPAEKKAVKKAAKKADAAGAAPAAPASKPKKGKGRKGRKSTKGKGAAARRPATSTKRKGDRVMVKRDKSGRRVKRVSVVLKNPSLGSIKAMAKQTVTTAVPALAGGALMGLIDAKLLAGRQLGLRILGKLTAAGLAMALMRKYPRSAATMAGAMLGTLGYELLTRFSGGFMAPSKEEVKKELGALVREDPYAIQGLLDASGAAYSQFPSLQGGAQYFPDEVHTG